MAHDTGYCQNCKKQVLILKKDVNHLLHLILTIITGGIWLIIWMVVGSGGDWRCSLCGNKVKQGSTEKETNKSGFKKFAIVFVFLLIVIASKKEQTAPNHNVPRQSANNISIQNQRTSDTDIYKELELIHESINLLGNGQYFYLYKGDSPTKEHLTKIVNAAKSRLRPDESLNIYDNKQAATIDYMAWENMANLDDSVLSISNPLNECHNFTLKHLLVSTFSDGTAVFNNFELNKKYQEHLRIGTYKKCNPTVIIQKHLPRVQKNTKRRQKRLALKNSPEIPQGCQNNIRKKFRFIDNLSFSGEVVVRDKDGSDNLLVLGSLKATQNGYTKSADYECIYIVKSKIYKDIKLGEWRI